MNISPARAAAFEILQRIELERSFSSTLLPLFEERLGGQDRGLCHQLVLGVLRRQIYLDRVIQHYAGAKKLDPAVRTSLRLGIYQLLFLNKIPAYSAINESVNLVQKAKKMSAKGFVNAILRRASEKIPQFEFADDVERISVETSHPIWLIEAWMRDLGAEKAEAVATANNIQPQIAFRFTGKGRTASDFDFKRGEFVDGCFIAPHVTDGLRDMADRGEIYFQDEASQLVAQTVSRSIGSRFLDVCAAPGGKTTQIASTMPQAFVTAGDIYSSRIRLLGETFVRQGIDAINIAQYDAEFSIPFADESFDTVLVDAPCSGTGTIRHSPEIRYFLTPEDFLELANKQRTILKNASKVVRPGGRLIYSTCSLQIMENEAVCHEFIAGSDSFDQVRPNVPEKFVTGSGFARTFPHRDGVDGFFIAEFKRRG